MFTAAAGETVAAALRGRLPGRSWSDVRRFCASGKVMIEGVRQTDPALRLHGGESIELRMNTPDPQRLVRPVGFSVVHDDAHLIVIEKPQGVTSVPFERKDTGTALDLIRDEWRRLNRRATATPLYTVHRLDKDTSGLLCFAKTRLAEKGLHQVFQQHLADRQYVAVAHGDVRGGRIESHLTPDRGDGLRGSLRQPNREQGQYAVTHVTVVERFRMATMCRVRLETGRTHQIRIHLSEQGHPLVGETVYIRDLLREGLTPLPSRRLLLHAETLAFDHPVTGDRLAFSAPLPEDFEAELTRLRESR